MQSDFYVQISSYYKYKISLTSNIYENFTIYYKYFTNN